MERELPTEGRYLKSTTVSGYILLNSEKLNRVLDLLDGITQPRNSEEGRVLKEAQAIKDTKELKGTDMAILALYDRLGGGIKNGERKMKIGVFFDFKARKPRTAPEVDESDYEDELVLVRKKNRRASTKESDTDRIKRLEGKEEKEETPAATDAEKEEKEVDSKKAKKS